MTPGNALAILRILQEAITNALKHGPARNITIRGALAPDGMVAITVENDGGPFVEKIAVTVSPICAGAPCSFTANRILKPKPGTKLTLLLPPSLPDFEDEAVA